MASTANNDLLLCLYLYSLIHSFEPNLSKDDHESENIVIQKEAHRDIHSDSSFSQRQWQRCFRTVPKRIIQKNNEHLHHLVTSVDLLFHLLPSHHIHSLCLFKLYIFNPLHICSLCCINSRDKKSFPGYRVTPVSHTRKVVLLEAVLNFTAKT